MFPDFKVHSARSVEGRGNSKIYQLKTKNEKYFALKIYPDRQFDHRPRLEVESLACKTLNEADYPVPKALIHDQRLNWGILDWVAGETFNKADEDFVEHTLNIVKKLQKDSSRQNFNQSFPMASEACLSGKEIVRQIKDRYSQLEQVGSTELQQYLRQQFYPIVESAVKMAKVKAGNIYDTELSRKLQMLSPSDMGAHNAIRDTSGRTVFIDFEYFGWDDPVKLACDFYFHPAMNLSSKLKKAWLNGVKDIFGHDATFEMRLNAYLPLYGLRWCLILLNEYMPNRLRQRNHAESQASTIVSSVANMQLDKAKRLLQQLIERVNYGPALQAA